MPKGDLAENAIDQLSIGVARVGRNHELLGFNQRFVDWFSPNIPEEELLGADFYQALGFPFFFEGTYAPFYFACKDNKQTRTIVGELDETQPREGYEFNPKLSTCKRIFLLVVTPLFEGANFCNYIVEIVDYSESTRLELRLDMLKSAGSELTEVVDQYQVFNEEEQKTRLIELIKQHMITTLKQDVFEIRILEPGPKKRLIPFLSFGLNPDAAQRELFAESNNNGITGYVADSGEPYICDDAQNDAHYRQGAINARSSLTVPLIFCNKVIGVCNVESFQPHAFSKKDETFLQLYAKDLAFAIHLHRSISNKLHEVRMNWANRISQDIVPISSQIFDHSLSAYTSLNLSAPETIRLNASELIKESDELSCKLTEIKNAVRSAKQVTRGNQLDPDDYPESWQDAIEAYPNIVKFLAHKRALFVSKDDPTVVIEQLDKLGCQVDVVRSTRNALEALKAFKYDLVFTERNPDGVYFEFDPDKKEAGRNAFGFNVYDIHEGDNYFVPVEGNEEDQNDRQRVHDEVYVQRKLDAYFFKQALDELKLEHSPFFIVCVFNSEYDPTHIVNGLTKYNHGWMQPMFFVSPKSPKALLKCVNDYMIVREDVNSNNSQR